MQNLMGAFLLLTLATFSATYYFMRPRTATKRVVRRLNVIHRAPSSADLELIELVQKTRNVADAVGDAFARYGFSHHLALRILFAGRSDSVGYILLLSAAFAGGCCLLNYLSFHTVPLACLSGVSGGLTPYLWLRRAGSKRIKRFNEALPDAIDLMSRALRAGHSSGSAIEIIAEQSPKPLSEEFGRCFQRQKFGIPFRDALLELGERVPSKDLHFLITAILVQKETGGDLTQILDRATIVIRERVRIEGEVKSYTAQGRLTGWILGALPLVMLVMINLLTPGYTHVLFADPLGQKLMYTAAGLISIGALIIRKIVDVKV